MTQAFVGVARRDITPRGPVLLAGFGQRTEPSVGVRDPLAVTALSIRRGETRLVLVTADLLHVPEALAAAVLARLADDGLDRAEVCIAASHTHSGPVPYEPRSAEPGVAAFARLVVSAMVEAVREARAVERPALVRSTVGTFDRMWNRRSEGSFDTRVPVFAAHDASSGAPVAVLFGLGCHPTTLGWDSNVVSADFPGHARRAVEAELGGGLALFVNTTEGDVVPATSARRDALDPRGYRTSGPDDTATMGDGLAASVLAALAATPPPGPLGRLRSVRLDLALVPNHAELTAVGAAALREQSDAVLRRYLGAAVAQVPPARLWSVASAVVVERDLPTGEMRELMVAVCQQLVALGVAARGAAAPSVRFPVQVIRLHDLDLLAVPGEALTDVGTRWSAAAGHDRSFVVGLANAHLRYLPTAAHFAEAEAGVRYETITAGAGPGAVDDAVAAAALALVD